MFSKIYSNFTDVDIKLADYLLNRGELITTEKWQGIEGVPMLELLNISFTMANDPKATGNKLTRLNRDWADAHFEERVGKVPLNPPPSHKLWPPAIKGNYKFMENEKFSHTYPERFWPKYAGEETPRHPNGTPYPTNMGVRFGYGDLQDVVNLLIKEPKTRQAYLPVWFPEDTGVVHGKRVPCSLGYHFQLRDKLLYVNYHLRSCDFLLHFHDDIYLCIKLQRWIIDKINDHNRKHGLYHLVNVGPTTLTIDNLHCFENGKYKLQQICKG